MTDPRQRARAGLFLGLGAYACWGILPLYFKLLSTVPPTVIVAHRVLWSLVLLAALLGLWKRWPAFRVAIATPGILGMLVLTAALISVNWLTYIWAILHNNVMAGSLGYYLNPLVNVLFGVVLLKERLTRLQLVSVILAAAGVAVLAAGAPGGLWISFTLAVSFSLYGLLRKVTPVEAIEGLAIETLLIAPVAIGWLGWLSTRSEPWFGDGGLAYLLLVLSGAITAVPLLLFNAAAKRLSYSTLGFLQYVAPTLQLLVAVLVFGETMTTAHYICFGAIWTALALFAADGVRNSRAAARERAAAGL